MKALILTVMLVLYPLALFSHPGKTDFRGGHKCWNGCTAWALDYGEYHLHDKYFRPIRLGRKGKPAEAPELLLEQAGTPLQTVETKSAETATVYRYVTVVNEEHVFPSDRELLLALLALLLLLLLAIISRRRKEKTTMS